MFIRLKNYDLDKLIHFKNNIHEYNKYLTKTIRFEKIKLVDTSLTTTVVYEENEKKYVMFNKVELNHAIVDYLENFGKDEHTKIFKFVDWFHQNKEDILTNKQLLFFNTYVNNYDVIEDKLNVKNFKKELGLKSNNILRDLERIKEKILKAYLKQQEPNLNNKNDKELNYLLEILTNIKEYDNIYLEKIKCDLEKDLYISRIIHSKEFNNQKLLTKIIRFSRDKEDLTIKDIRYLEEHINNRVLELKK